MLLKPLFEPPKFQLSVFGLSADLFQLAWFKGSLALQSAQLADSESAFLGRNSRRRETPWNWNVWAFFNLRCTCYKSTAVCWTESTGCLQLPQRMFIHFSTCHFFASHIRLWRQHPAAVYVAKIRPFPADLTLVDAAVAYLWPKQPPKAKQLSGRIQLQ